MSATVFSSADPVENTTRFISEVSAEKTPSTNRSLWDQELAKLIDSGICPSARYEGYPLLHLTVNKRLKQSSLALLRQGVDIHQRDDKGNTALLLAADSGMPDMCLLLLRHGADIHERDANNQTAFELLALNNYPEKICGDFVKHGGNVNAQTYDRPTQSFGSMLNALTTTLSLDPQDAERCEELLDYGANIHMHGKKEVTFIRNIRDYKQAKSKTSTSGWMPDISAPELHPAWKNVLDKIEAAKEAYDAFVASSSAPTDVAQIYQFLSVMPLADPHAPVDQHAQLRRIFAHTPWEKGQAARMAHALCERGTVSAAFAEELAAIGEPRKIRSLSLSGGRSV